MANLEKKHKTNLDAVLFGLALDHGTAGTLHTQLTDALRSIILADPDLSGARLPASRKLAEELSVSRTTVQGVYDQLLGEGYLSARRGSGTFIASNVPHLSPPSARIADSRREPQAWRPFHTGIPDQSLFPHRIWARHLERAWHAPHKALLARPDAFGWYPLRAAIADHLAAWRGLDCQPEQVLITSGAWETFDVIFRGLLGQPGMAAIEDPGWPSLRDVLGATQTKAYPVRIDAEGLNAADIPVGTSVVVVTPSRHFPTGVTMPLARRAALLQWAARHGGLLVEDDYDSEFRYKGQPLPSLAGLDGLRRCVYMGSFSKLLSPALRIGYLVLPHEHLDTVRQYVNRVGARASLVPQPALATFMNSGEFAIHLRRMRRVYAKRQNHLISELSQVADLLDIGPDPAGMHICAPLLPALSRRTTDRDIAALARKAGLSLKALSPHCARPDPPQGLLLGYAAFEEPALTDAARTLTDILRRIAAN